MKLNDIPFSDLIITAAPEGGGDVLVKGLSSDQSGVSRIEDQQAVAEVMDLLARIKKEHYEGHTIEHDGYRYRVSVGKMQFGVAYFLRRMPECPGTMRDLGYPKVIIEELMSMRSGLVVFAGSMRSGKTAGVSAFVADWLSRNGGHAITFEDPPEILLEGPHGDHGWCLQREVPMHQFGPAIVEGMRHAAPEILMLGEVREEQGATEAIRAGINGHLVPMTLHADGIGEAIMRLAALGNFGGSQKAALSMVSHGLRAIVHQRLVPKAGGRVGLKTRVLLIDEDRWPGVRSRIGKGEILQLSTILMQQRNALLHGKNSEEPA